MDADTAFEEVARALAEIPGVTRAKMFGSLGLKVRGKVFACLAKGELVVKLPRERVEALAAAGVGHPFDPGMGRTMKEWVAVPPAEGAGWLPLAEEAMAFVSSRL